MDHRTIGVLGGGQLGRLLVEAANNRNISVAVLDKHSSPAKQVNANPGIDGSFTDPQAIRRLASQCDILTIEIEHVDTYVLEELEKESRAQGQKLSIYPNWETIRVIQDKYLQKQRLVDAGVDVAQSMPIASATEAELQTAARKFGFPFMLKARTGAYDGRGNHVIKSSTDFTAALNALNGRPLYAEEWASFAKELAVMVVSLSEQADPATWESTTLSFPTVETVHQDSICKLVYAPARGISADTNLKAQTLARRAIASFKGKGIFGVEMFLLEDDTILVNEIAPRPHNSGHYTIEACRFSQYDAHLCAIFDWEIPPKALSLLKPAIMLNILGGTESYSYSRLANAAQSIGASIHLYGKGAATKGRKMGHLTYLGDTMEEAEQALEPMIAIADEISGAEPSHISSTQKPRPQPLVGIITGSISDQPHLEACYKILTDLAIPFEKGIKSAHRTPREMASYAESAAHRGFKVIIAAAGGAAHLPGMVAAFSKTIPVIGLPIKPSIGDGWDSLASMTNMPRGCPVLTVGVNNSTNAALGAARILAGWDEGVKERVREYVDRAEKESLENDSRLREDYARRA